MERTEDNWCCLIFCLGLTYGFIVKHKLDEELKEAHPDVYKLIEKISNDR